MNVLSGCDFITPHSYKNLPKCRLCNAKKIDINHLLFKCPGRASALKWTDKIAKRLNSLKNHANEERSSAASQVLSVFEDLVNNNDFSGLGKFVFGCACKENGGLSPLRYLPILGPIIEITATELAGVQLDWMNATR